MNNDGTKSRAKTNYTPNVGTRKLSLLIPGPDSGRKRADAITASPCDFPLFSFKATPVSQKTYPASSLTLVNEPVLIPYISNSNC